MLLASCLPGHARAPAHAGVQGADAGGTWLLVEIPAGGAVKYESDSQGRIFVDRFLPVPMAYPANYGSIPQTLAGDGDPLDALVLTRSPLLPGVLIRFRPVGYLRMTDGGERDEKVIGVPVDEVDGDYARMRELRDLPAGELQRIEAFFRLYKQRPDGGGPVELAGTGDAAQAQALIDQALQRHAEHAAGGR
jgi:inorganic pyrophosphatase